MRVLLIEDDNATAQSIDLMLKSESFNVYRTDLGEEGVSLGALYDYDIILLDLNLPDMSGFEVLRSLRVSKVKTPILILSGIAGIEHKVKGLGLGADDYMNQALPSMSLWRAFTPSCAAPGATPNRSSRSATLSSTSTKRRLRSTAFGCTLLEKSTTSWSCCVFGKA
jgi:CheY-like chemotaxis protein